MPQKFLVLQLFSLALASAFRLLDYFLEGLANLLEYVRIVVVLMSGELNQSFLVKKAFEISYAVFRVVSPLKQTAFKNELENWAIKILSGAASENYEEVKKSIEVLEHLLRLGAEVGLIHQNNAQLITNEARALNSAIAEFIKESAKMSEVDLTKVFSENFSKGEIENKKAMLTESDLSVLNGNFSPNSAIRQSAILERIRQNSNCRLKELQELLPEVSERTLRYDLQNLIERDLIERIGNGGPSTYYRLKENGIQLEEETEKRKNVKLSAQLETKESLTYLKNQTS